MMDDSKPIFLQVAQTIENDILSGALAEGEQTPSTTQISQFYRINPATAGKGLNLLVERGILYKERGIGMFVTAGAQEIIRQHRKHEFHESFIAPLLIEAKKLGITSKQLLEMIKEVTQ